MTADHEASTPPRTTAPGSVPEPARAMPPPLPSPFTTSASRAPERAAANDSPVRGRVSVRIPARPSSGRRRSIWERPPPADLVVTRPDRLRPTLPSARVMLAIAAALLLVSGAPLVVVPLRTDRSFAWTVDVPLTAVFLGAAYWSIAALVLAAAWRRLWCDARVAVPATTVTTALTLVAALIHRGQVHLDPELASSTRTVAWAWLASCALVPALMLVVAAEQSHEPGGDRPRAEAFPAWIEVGLAAEALVLLLAGAGLFLAPGRAARWWPWPLTAVEARAVGACCVGLGVAAAHACRERDVRRLQPAALAFVVLGLLQGAALARYGDALDRDRPVSWVYVAFLGQATVVGLVALWHARRAERSARAGEVHPSARPGLFGGDGSIDLRDPDPDRPDERS